MVILYIHKWLGILNGSKDWFGFILRVLKNIEHDGEKFFQVMFFFMIFPKISFWGINCICYNHKFVYLIILREKSNMQNLLIKTNNHNNKSYGTFHLETISPYCLKQYRVILWCKRVTGGHRNENKNCWIWRNLSIISEDYYWLNI